MCASRVIGITEVVYNSAGACHGMPLQNKFPARHKKRGCPCEAASFSVQSGFDYLVMTSRPVFTSSLLPLLNTTL